MNGTSTLLSNRLTVSDLYEALCARTGSNSVTCIDSFIPCNNLLKWVVKLPFLSLKNLVIPPRQLALKSYPGWNLRVCIFTVMYTLSSWLWNRYKEWQQLFYLKSVLFAHWLRVAVFYAIWVRLSRLVPISTFDLL